MKNIKKNLIRIVVLLSIVVMSCQKDNATPATSRKVVFKAEASAGSRITDAVYGYDATLTSRTGLNGNNWSSSELSVPANAMVLSAAVNAVGADANATLKLQIYVDGALKKETTVGGTFMSANIQYAF